MFTSILAIDSTTETCSVALLTRKKELFEKFVFCPNNHTNHILFMIDDILNKSKTKNINKLDALAFCLGPGSFTGIKVCIGIIQSLSLNNKLPTIGISTLEVLAESAFRKTGINNVLVSIVSKRKEFYWATYNRVSYGKWHGKNTESVQTIHSLKNSLVNLHGLWTTAGNGWKNHSNLIHKQKLKIIPGRTVFPKAKDIIIPALFRLFQRDYKSIYEIEPNFLYKI